MAGLTGGVQSTNQIHHRTKFGFKIRYLIRLPIKPFFYAIVSKPE